MATNGITPTTGGINLSSAEQRTPTQELGKNEFLQILAVQLANQDPLQPMEDTDFIAQMAQFSSLEQMQELNSTFASSQVYSLIGKNVVGSVEDGMGGKMAIFGRVTGVVRQGSTDYLQVGSYLLPIGAISEIYDTGIDSNALISQSANLVGKTIEATLPAETSDGKDETVTGEVEAILVKDGTVYAKLKGVDGEEGKEVPVAYITKIS